MRFLHVIAVFLSVFVLSGIAVADTPGSRRPSPLDDPAFFTLAVWLQNPANAWRYRAAGINTYVGLWDGPTEGQLAELKRAGLFVVAEQNDVALSSPDNDIVIAWMHGDEPDNAQPLPFKLGYGQPIPPDAVVADYHEMKQRDPTRPVFLNLGQGVAWDGWHGRGARSGHPEDYPRYVEGGDIVSFDIYPVVSPHPEVAGKLEFVARGVARLRGWAGPEQIIWNCIEASRIGNLERKPSPDQIRAEVWMALVHGSKGLIYFVHQFQPNFVEASLLQDRELFDAIAGINKQILDLAPVLNSPSIDDAVEIETDAGSSAVAAMVKRHDGALYIFAVAMSDRGAKATFSLRQAEQSNVDVIGEGRSITLSSEATFKDIFEPYAVHLYRID